MLLIHSFETGPGPTDPGLEPDRVLKKNRERQNPNLLSQKPGCSPLTFVFFLN